MHIYLDTSVLLARWAQTDPYHAACRSLFDRLTKTPHWGDISWLCLVETASVVTRQYTKFEDTVANEYTETQLVAAFLRHIVDHPGVQVLPPSPHVSLQVGQKKIQVKLSTVKAIDIAPKLGFTSLDNLHLAIASLASASKGHISYFVTGDVELLNHATLIEKHLQFTTVNPKQILKKLEAPP